MNRIFIASWTSVALLITPGAFAQVDQADANAVVDAWAAAFNECSADKLSALYDPAATLWGTGSPALASTPEGIRSYFARACAAQPPIKVSIGERTTRVFGNSAASAGAYSFVQDGRTIPARFSFALVGKDGKWAISQHHSSLMPGRP